MGNKENEFLILRFGFLVAAEHAVGINLRELRRDEADKHNHRESAQHGNRTAVDGIDGVAHHHVHDSQSYAPNEASPNAARSHTSPIEAQHEGSQEGTSQSAP